MLAAKVLGLPVGVVFGRGSDLFAVLVNWTNDWSPVPDVWYHARGATTL